MKSKQHRLCTYESKCTREKGNKDCVDRIAPGRRRNEEFGGRKGSKYKLERERESETDGSE